MRISIKNLVASLALFLFMSILYKCNVSAANKAVEIPLDKEYKNCEFTVSFENKDAAGFNLTIQSPDGNVERLAIGDNNTATYYVETAIPGTWVVRADNGSEDTEEDVIGEIKVSVKAGVDGGTEAQEQRISVAKEISGLNHYFKDDSIVIEWTDDTVGNVNVEITNAKTLEKYFSSVVRDKKVEVPLPESAQEITISVVPSVSEKILGAGNQFTIKVENNPDATLSFNEVEYTNDSNLEYRAVLGQAYSIEYYVNGRHAGGEQKMPAGEYTLYAPLSEGVNEVYAYVVDDAGNMRSTHTTTILDTEPPTLQIERDLNGVVTKDTSIEFAGKAEGYNSLKFNGREIDADYDGQFKVAADLAEGANRFQILATDVAGNEVEYTAEVTMVVDVKRQIPWAYIVLGVIILGLVIYIAYNRFMTTHEVVYEEAVETTEEVKEEKPKRTRFRGKHKGLLFDIVSILVPVAVIVAFINLAISVARCESASMAPTINVGDVIVQNKLAYIIREPQRGDVVCFKSTETTGKIFVKRIVGMPGEHISFKDGYVYINGQKCLEEYLGEDMETNSEKEFDVPDGCYFVLGDNRENSDDARYWNSPYLQKKDIISRVAGNFDVSFIVEYLNGKSKS